MYLLYIMCRYTYTIIMLIYVNTFAYTNIHTHQSAQLPSTTRPNYHRTISIPSTFIDTTQSYSLY